MGLQSGFGSPFYVSGDDVNLLGLKERPSSFPSFHEAVANSVFLNDDVQVPVNPVTINPVTANPVTTNPVTTKEDVVNSSFDVFKEPSTPCREELVNSVFEELLKGC